ncbi:Asparaginase/glutaminase [Dothidotthia symphoricarpi CBS 119687]|uniref:asparaginase n=1 Tax=Dothidotthia symphoricarpi CBS 119687 TaxID=1392245 RepID=A0A6A6A6C2_9PLEO|nr:Asparaginase/glutaminase [Dothidotthia symphoricarpi CBS 119687]KAF2127106.1 Asparaginase/glutaminase [Dothidotthia symphoricarpi CBS 119687]
MLSSILTTALVVTTVVASPLQIQKREDPNTGLTWIYKDATLPKVMLYNTGDGTILSGSTHGRLDNINYGGGSGSLTPETLISSVSEVLDIAQLAVRNIGGGGSANANSDRFLNISMDATKRLCSDDSDIVGAVMIHGTNTLAETAFGVDLTLNCSKPFVATGSMRPNSALSADGPFNFYDAVRTAIHPEARDRGAMIAFNDHLVSVFYGTKTNGNTVTTFLAMDQGYIAQFLAGQPYFFYGASLPKARHFFDPFKLQYPLPKVVVLYGHQGFDAGLLRAAVADGAKGIVIMGVGPGGLSTAATQAANELFEQGVVTVASLRPFFGAVVPGPQTSNIISSGFLHGEQSRIQLQLAMASGYDVAGIRKLFEGDIRKAVYNDATAFYNATTL